MVSTAYLLTLVLAVAAAVALGMAGILWLVLGRDAFGINSHPRPCGEPNWSQVPATQQQLAPPALLYWFKIKSQAAS